MALQENSNWREDFARSVEAELSSVMERRDAILRMQQAVDETRIRLALEARDLERHENELLATFADLTVPEPSGDDPTPTKSTESMKATNYKYAASVRAAVMGHLLRGDPLLG